MNRFLVWILLVVLTAECRRATADGRVGCGDSASPDDWVKTRVDTTDRVGRLRAAMASADAVGGPPLAAYIVTGRDEHQSENVAKHDQRRQYLTGFSGPSGLAVVTHRQAALWTGSRYFQQAEHQVDCNWQLMKWGQVDGDAAAPTVVDWLKSTLRAGQRVGADAKLVSADQWLEWTSQLDRAGILLDSVHSDLVDVIWTKARPSVSHRPVFVHDLSYAGVTWQDKVAALRNELVTLRAGAMIVSALDEVAWLLNIRGTDIEYAPLVKSYAFVPTQPDGRVVLYVDTAKISSHVRRHLNTDYCQRETCVELRPYDDALTDLARLTADVGSVLLASSHRDDAGVHGGASFALYRLVAPAKRVAAVSPLVSMMARKNVAEAEGMRKAHLRDGVAISELMSLLDEKVVQSQGRSGTWDELSVATAATELRKEQQLSRGASSATVAVSVNGPSARCHLDRLPATAQTNRRVDNTSLLLLSSGGQYLDGTTSVTRTWALGRPTSAQKEKYTRALMDVIDTARLVFSEDDDDSVDVATGPSVGAFLSVRQGPSQLHTSSKIDRRLREHYFVSDESPAADKGGDCAGIRLESILRVIRKTTSTDHNSTTTRRYLGFQVVTLVPYEHSLIASHLMTHQQMQWLNDYHALVRVRLGEELKRQNRTRAFHWLMKKTGHMSPHRSDADAAAAAAAAATTAAATLVTLAALLPLLLL